MSLAANVLIEPSLTLKRRLKAPPASSLRRLDGPGKNSALVRAAIQVPVEHGRIRRARRRPLPHRLPHRGRRSITDVSGVYREVVPNERLVFSWAWHSTPERESLVTVADQA